MAFLMPKWRVLPTPNRGRMPLPQIQISKEEEYAGRTNIIHHVSGLT